MVRFIFGEEGIFGSALSATVTFVFLFCLFGSFLQNFDGGQFFIDLATCSAGKYRGGPAKVAVIASAFFGTISGSAIANVATTGTFTIPLMKKTGYKPEFAGAVEAVASTGGQIMPPVMGATAFLMSEITGIPYFSICIAAVIPALLYFLSVFIMVDLEAVKLGLKGLNPEIIPDIKKILKEKWPLLAPLIAIIIVLLFLKMSASRTALIGIIVTIIAPLFCRGIKITPAKIIGALEDGAKSCVGIIVSSTCAGIIVAIMAKTGLGIKIGAFLINLSGGHLSLMLVFTAVITLVLGMGLPTPSAYIVCVAVVGQTLVGAGVPLMTTHLFIFYFAILSTVTPPVALSSYTAAAIAKCNPNKTGFQGLRLALVAFIVPFMFTFGESLLMNGTPPLIIQTVITAIIGVICLSGALEGYIMGKLNPIQRILLFAAALLFIDPGLVTDLAGLACAAGALLPRITRKIVIRRKRSVET
jgi:TRAP transporter 4TM/12TM fusion protein